jgi:hypothetical protein
VIYTGEDGARGSAPVSRRWRIVRETKTGGTSGGRVTPAGGGGGELAVRWKKRRPAGTSGRGGAEQGQGQQYRNERRLIGILFSAAFCFLFSLQLGRCLSTFFFSEVGHLCAITSELDLFVIGPVAETLALWFFFIK